MPSNTDRIRLAEPPSTDELLALSRGELSAEDEARVREQLTRYPELAEALTIPFGEDTDALPAEVIDRQWRSFRGRPPLPPRQPIVWQGITALAAALALTFGALLRDARLDLSRPRVIAGEQILQSGSDRGHRGGGETVLSDNAGDVVLIASLHDQPQFPAYRVEVMERGTPRWSATAATRGGDDILRILIPGGALKPGPYAIAVHGINGRNAQKLVEYPFRVERRRQ